MQNSGLYRSHKILEKEANCTRTPNHNAQTSTYKFHKPIVKKSRSRNQQHMTFHSYIARQLLILYIIKIYIKDLFKIYTIS